MFPCLSEAPQWTSSCGFPSPISPKRLRARRASPRELMEAVLARIAATQPTLNAFTALRGREALLEDARSAEARIAGARRGPSKASPSA